MFCLSLSVMKLFRLKFKMLFSSPGFRESDGAQGRCLWCSIQYTEAFCSIRYTLRHHRSLVLVPHNTPLVAPSCRWLRIEATANDLKVETKFSPPFLSIETFIGFCIGNFLQRALACSQVLIYLQKNLNAGGHFLCLDRKMVTSSTQSACAVTSCLKELGERQHHPLVSKQ